MIAEIFIPSDMQEYVDHLRLVQSLVGGLQLDLVDRNYLSESGSTAAPSLVNLEVFRPKIDLLYDESVKLVRNAESLLLHAAFAHVSLDQGSLVQELLTLIETVERLCRFLHTERRISSKFGPVLARTISQFH